MTNTNTSDTSKSILTCSRVPHHLHAASVARHQGGLVPREGRIVEGVLASGVRPAVALVAVNWSCFCGWRWVEEVFGLCQGCFVGWGFKVGRKGETVRIGCIWSWATKFQKFLFTGYIKIPTKTSTGGSYPGETVEIIYIIAHKGGWMFFLWLHTVTHSVHAPDLPWNSSNCQIIALVFRLNRTYYRVHSYASFYAAITILLPYCCAFNEIEMLKFGKFTQISLFRGLFYIKTRIAY